MGVALLGVRRSRRTYADKCVRARHFLRTERLVFRTPTEWEMAAAQAAASDPGAQRWIGWAPESVVAKPERARYLKVAPGSGPEQPSPDSACLVAIHRQANRCAGMVTVSLEPSRGGRVGRFQLGGWLAPTFRGRGLGVELFRAGLIFGHGHLGLPRIGAAAEVTNVGSRRALIAAGFEAVDGPATYTLENGREMAACWYAHEATGVQRCEGPQPR